MPSLSYRRWTRLPSIVFQNSSLTSIACAHFLLDAQESLEIHLISGSFEVGLMGETPGIIGESGWPVVRPHWISEGGLDLPQETSTALRASWLAKSMAISLTQRGASFHTGSRILTHDEDSKKIMITVPGDEKTSEIHYDTLVTPETTSREAQWKGAVALSLPEWPSVNGRRSDGTHEFWWLDERKPENPLQTMSWVGVDPSSAVNDAITEARRISDNILSGSLAA